MMKDQRDAPGSESEIGLCRECRHARVVGNDRGSRFWLCELSRLDPRFPRYPRLPVHECSGYDPEDGGATS